MKKIALCLVTLLSFGVSASNILCNAHDATVTLFKGDTGYSLQHMSLTSAKLEVVGSEMTCNVAAKAKLAHCEGKSGDSAMVIDFKRSQKMSLASLEASVKPVKENSIQIFVNGAMKYEFAFKDCEIK